MKEETKIKEKVRELTLGSRKEGYFGLKDKRIDECTVEKKFKE